MNDTQTPIWRPISFLPTYAQMIDELLQDAKSQLVTLEEALPKPHVLDDALVARVIDCYSESASYIPMYREQLTRWQRLRLNTKQRREVERLKTQVGVLSDVLNAILSLADKLKENTIDAILRKDDAELAADLSTGKTPPPWGDTPLTEQQIRLATVIHEHVENVTANGGNDEDLLQSMADHMGTFKRLLDQSTHDEINTLGLRFPGFYRFAKLLEAMAQGIADGSIRVPE